MITVLGEVSMPGQYTLYTHKASTIFEGLGLAGDITVHGNKENVTLLREENGIIKRWQVDMTNDNSFFATLLSKSGDVLLVRKQ